jgi:hypothetical protein
MEDTKTHCLDHPYSLMLLLQALLWAAWQGPLPQLGRALKGEIHLPWAERFISSFCGAQRGRKVLWAVEMARLRLNLSKGPWTE